MTAVLALIARYWRAGLAIAAAVAVGVLRAMWHRDGRQEAEREAITDANERMAKGREAVREGREHGDPADRLRRNDGAW